MRFNQQDKKHLDIFETAVAAFPEVIECSLMTGEADYQLRTLVASLSDFGNVLRHLSRIEGVAQVTASFALRSIVYETVVPVSVS